ncbi:hypothetical protein AGR5A_Cc110046 [Agrobacterium genomosp. 5 str. CFBP 6626]|nr:hypothetical protein AGR5A_Cc110046 [Agrobacterium genomosp. 5 str. CFBP 6626]
MRLLRCSVIPDLTAGKGVLRFCMTGREAGAAISGFCTAAGKSKRALALELKAGTEIRLASHSASSSPLRRGSIAVGLSTQNGSSGQARG